MCILVHFHGENGYIYSTSSFSIKSEPDVNVCMTSGVQTSLQCFSRTLQSDGPRRRASAIYGCNCTGKLYTSDSCLMRDYACIIIIIIILHPVITPCISRRSRTPNMKNFDCTV